MRPGGELTGADAEIAEMEECDPFAYSQAFIEREGEVNPVAEISWDPRTPGRTEVCEARARLIAAAPEMAELLEEFNKTLDGFWNTPARERPAVAEAFQKRITNCQQKWLAIIQKLKAHP